MMVIVSKAVFEKEAKKGKPGAVLPMKVYRSASKHLSRLDDKSRLFLVTVRPPKEALWLVAVLEQLQFDGAQWNAARNKVPVTDISGLLGQLKFDSGKGVQAKPGALGMSLQTPRVLSDGDVALLLAAAAVPAKPPRPPGPVNVAQHQAVTPLPCLCGRCLATAPETVDGAGVSYFRASAEAQGRVLWFWVPATLKDELPEVVAAVQARMRDRLEPYQTAGSADDGADDGDDDE